MAMKYREPVVAGSFYPQAAEELRAQLTVLLSSNPEQDLIPRALIVPHAGYIYSGKIAGDAYCYLKKYQQKISRVILLGPSHQVPLANCALSQYLGFNTPLGTVILDTQSIDSLTGENLATQYSLAHRWEHSLEVQLPFLQCLLADFELVPVVVGSDDPKEISKLLATLYEPEKDMIIVSTDLSHYHSYYECNRLDKLTIDKILNLNPTIGPKEACGCSPLNGLLEFSHSQGWKIKLVSQANSGDVSGDKSGVVGYASFVMY